MWTHLLIIGALTGLVLLALDALDAYDQWIASHPQGEKDGTSEDADTTDRDDPV